MRTFFLALPICICSTPAYSQGIWNETGLMPGISIEETRNILAGLGDDAADWPIGIDDAQSIIVTSETHGALITTILCGDILYRVQYEIEGGLHSFAQEREYIAKLFGDHSGIENEQILVDRDNTLTFVTNIWENEDDEIIVGLGQVNDEPVHTVLDIRRPSLSCIEGW